MKGEQTRLGETAEESELRELMCRQPDGSWIETLPTPSDSDTTLDIALSALKKQGYPKNPQAQIPSSQNGN